MNRHGTFLSEKGKDHASLIKRMMQLLRDAIASNNNDEELTILNNIETDLSEASISRNIHEEGLAPKFSISDQEIEWLDRQPEDRWMDYMVYRYKFKIYPSQQKLCPFPIYLLIEPASVCNLRCIMCFQIDKTFTKKENMGLMPWDLFVKIADQAAEGGTKAVTLASRGEPTLNPRFGDMLKYLNDKGIIDLKINTNATRLNETISHQILSAGVNEVVFSVDAGTRDTYESIRVGGKFDSVVSNIKEFNKVRDQHYKSSSTVTRISGVKVRNDQDEEQMKEFWKEYVDQVTIKPAQPRWDSYNNPKNDVSHACSTLWERMYVWYDGKVNPCDFDYKSELCVGNVNESLIQDIWLGEQYQELRNKHLEKQRNKCYPCDRCPLY